jgi:hypothetical protein
MIACECDEEPTIKGKITFIEGVQCPGGFHLNPLYGRVYGAYGRDLALSFARPKRITENRAYLTARYCSDLLQEPIRTGLQEFLRHVKSKCSPGFRVAPLLL